MKKAPPLKTSKIGIIIIVLLIIATIVNIVTNKTYINNVRAKNATPYYNNHLRVTDYITYSNNKMEKQTFDLYSKTNSNEIRLTKEYISKNNKKVTFSLFKDGYKYYAYYVKDDKKEFVEPTEAQKALYNYLYINSLHKPKVSYNNITILSSFKEPITKKPAPKKATYLMNDNERIKSIEFEKPELKPDEEIKATPYSPMFNFKRIDTKDKNPTIKKIVEIIEIVN